MPRVRSTTLEYPTTRLKLAPNPIPYPGPTLARGIKLNYRRNANGAGTWVVRVANGAASNAKSPYWTKAIGLADDYDKADDIGILNYGQAQDRAKELARGDSSGSGKPITIDEALKAYEADLVSRGRSPKNVSNLRYHLKGDALLGKPVALLKPMDLLEWRNRLIAGGMKPATFNRVKNGFRAALGFAASIDARIGNHQTFRTGLKRVKDGNNARRAVLEDAQILRIIAEARVEGPQAFALLTETLAQTGARMSQLVRANCDALRGGDKIMVPSSYKGNEGKQQIVASVPITNELAIKLAKVRAGRSDDEPLFANQSGKRRTESDAVLYGRAFRRAVERAGLDPRTITPYSLRHSSICRALKAGVPMSIVSRLHDTSAREIESHYARYIEDVAEDIARRGLLQAPVDNVVVNLPSQRAHRLRRKMRNQVGRMNDRVAKLEAEKA
jgi:integrase